ncbi:MAG: ester cyclase [candidate division Zixibacteria bacterium]|nr:ester cyclase [candidate division Zixibacteria bacterium]
MSTDKTVAGYYDAWNRHDPEAIAEFFHKNANYSDPSAGKAVTPAALVEYAKTMFAAFPDYTLQISAISKVAENKYFVEYHILGANTGPLPDTPPSNKKVFVQAIDVIELEGGKIKAIRGFFDRLTMAEQLGWIQD